MGLIILNIMAYTEEELQEAVETLEETVSNHDEALASLVWALVSEESLSEDAREGIRAAYEAIYGKGAKKPR